MSSLVTKAKYLSSLLIPSPIEVEVALSLYNDRIEIPELEATTIYFDKVEDVKIIKGSELPAQTLGIAGIVGLIINKGKQYVVIELKSATSKGSTIADGLLLRFEDDFLANHFVKEVESKRNSLANAAA